MERIEQAGQTDAARAFKVNRIAAIGMVSVTAATLLLLRPELSLVYIAYVVVSVCPLIWVASNGVIGAPRPVTEQNLAAYVSISTVGFVVTLFGAPHVIELLGTAIYILFAAVIAVLVLFAVLRGGAGNG